MVLIDHRGYDHPRGRSQTGVFASSSNEYARPSGRAGEGRFRGILQRAGLFGGEGNPHRDRSADMITAAFKRPSCGISGRSGGPTRRRKEKKFFTPPFPPPPPHK